MNNLKKILSAFLVMLLVMSLAACSDLPKTSSPEWSYRSSDKEYAIGIHLYSIFSAYNQAYGVISGAQGESFDGSKSILDIESTFDETGKVMKCNDWILEEADEITRSIIGLDMMIEEYGIELEQSLVDNAREMARKDWYLGPYYEEYSSYGSASNPYKNMLEPFGISFESFFESTYLASVKQSAVFDKFYNKGGLEEISEKTLSSYFEKNYTSYGCFTVNLYESATNAETGETLNTPYDDAKIKDIKGELDYYTKMIKNGIDFDTIGEVYAAYAKLNYNPSYQNIEIVIDGDSDNLPEEAVKVLNSMKEGEAQVVYAGNEDSRIAYFLYKNPIKDHTKKYVEENYANLLQNLKGEEFVKKLEVFNEDVDCEVNSDALEPFTPAVLEKIIIG